MSTDTEIQHLKAKLEHKQAQLAKGEITEKSFGEYRSRIRGEAKKAGIDPELVAPIEKQAKKLEAAAPTGLRDRASLRIEDITIDPEIQQRAVDPGVRAEYAEAMRQGAQFPPVVLFDDGQTTWLADGFQRIGAAREIDSGVIYGEIREGTRRDALLYAVGANAEHGARRTNADKTRAIETLLADAEWSGRSNRWIAETAKVSHPFVEKVRESLAVKPTGNVSSQIDSDTVKSLAGRLADLPEPPAKPTPARQGRDGRTTNTANIGKKSSAPPTKYPPPPAPKPKAPTAADAQQTLNRFAGVCVELRSVESKLAETEIFKAAQLARDTLIHFLPKVAPKDRAAMAEKVSAAAGEVGHA